MPCHKVMPVRGRHEAVGELALGLGLGLELELGLANFHENVHHS